MKTAWLSLCAGLLFAAVPCQAQQPVADEPAPVLFVYVASYGENVLPRIALGLEKPALKIGAFEKCVRLSVANSKLKGLAAQLKADDLKTLVTAMKALGAPDARELPVVILWFATPDNKVLDCLNTGGTSGFESNLVKDGVLMFDADTESSTVNYLTAKLHPE